MEEKKLREFYPEIEPFNTGRLKVSELHEISYEQVGNKDGVPVVFLHGGPGGGIAPIFRRFFNPDLFHAVLFDQRGCGNSTPLGCLEDNNTDALVEDIEKLRKHLGIEKWILLGGSWGTTLALFYSLKYPERVTALVLRGVFLNRQKDIDWLFEDDSAAKVFPDYFEDYKNYIPEVERKSLVKAYYDRLISDDYNTRLESAQHWSAWENKISRLVYVERNEEEDNEQMIAGARIECLYMLKKCFFTEDNYIINNLEKIVHIPTYITHGRYDIVCNSANAWDLCKAWEEKSNGEFKPELVITPTSGHSQTEPENRSELIGFLEKIVSKQ